MGLQQPLNQPKNKKRAQASLTDVTALIKYLANKLLLLTADFDQHKMMSDDTSITILFMPIRHWTSFWHGGHSIVL